MHTQARLEERNQAGRSAWEPPQRDAPWRRTARRGGGGERERIAPWELPRERPTSGEREAGSGFEGIEALRRYIEAGRERAEQARRETERRARDQSAKATPKSAKALPRNLRQVVPTAVRASVLFGAWWTVQVRIAKDTTWWPVTGTATADPDVAETTAGRIRNGALRVLSDRKGNLMLGNGPA